MKVRTEYILAAIVVSVLLIVVATVQFSTLIEVLLIVGALFVISGFTFTIVKVIHVLICNAGTPITLGELMWKLFKE